MNRDTLAEAGVRLATALVRALAAFLNLFSGPRSRRK